VKGPSPTVRTRDYFREHGYRIDVVERWIGVGLDNKFMGTRKKRKDFCGFADLIAFLPQEIIAIQSTSRSNMSNRVKKIVHGIDAEPNSQESAIEWLLGEGRRRIIIQGWAKYAKPVDRKWWRALNREVLLDEFPVELVAKVRADLEERKKLAESLSLDA
jgi:hypothetical protein